MFSKQPGSSRLSSSDPQSPPTIEHIHSVDIEPAPTFEPPTLVNGSVIGSDLTILGENLKIISKESLQIDGEIHGDVSGKKVKIGISGMVVGTISAETVEIDGGVRGTVRAHAVRLNAESKVTGEVLHQTLVIAEGAEFEGSVRRVRDDSELSLNLNIETTAPVAIAKSESDASAQDKDTNTYGVL